MQFTLTERPDCRHKKIRWDVNMEKGLFLGVVFLCIINAAFMVVGIFLNSVVIISLWRSSQLRGKLCYFIILILSCFDLAVVVVTHPLLIVSSIYFSVEEEVSTIRGTTKKIISFNLYGFSMIALLTLNVERFLAITCPFFYQASVTKTRLLYFKAFLMAIVVGASSFYFIRKSVAYVVAVVFVSSLLLLFVYSNYKLLVIAKSKRDDKKNAPLSAQTSNVDQNLKKEILSLKNVSTCTLAVACFFLCSSTQIAYFVLRLTSDVSKYHKQVYFFHLWSNTITSMNSTFDCLIFFWRNSILRREARIENIQRSPTTEFIL